MKNPFKQIAELLTKKKPSLMTHNETQTKETFKDGIKRKMKESHFGRIDRMLKMNHKRFTFEPNGRHIEVVALNYANAVRKVVNKYPDADVQDFNISK